MMDPYKLAAAHLLNCEPDDLLKFRWSEEEQQYIVLAPSGAKHRFDRDQLVRAKQVGLASPLPTPTPAPIVKPAEAGPKPAAPSADKKPHRRA